MGALLASSCSGLSSPTDPLSSASGIDDAQFANLAPQVGMTAEIRASHINGLVFTDFHVEVAVQSEVRPREEKGDEPISATSPFVGANISAYVTGPMGRIVLTKSGNSFVHNAHLEGYTPGVFSIVVEYGGRPARTASVTAPDLHSIDSHAPNDHVEAGKPLKVTWSSVSSADEVIVATRDIAIGPRSDNGQATIPPRGNPARDDQFIQVSRINRVRLPGNMKCEVVAETRDRVEPIIAE
jgi:hypothetical protein